MARIIEHIKTVLFIALFVGAVTMAGIYIAAQPRAETAGDLPDEVLSALRGGGGSEAAVLSGDHLLPEFLGIKESGKAAVSPAGSVAMLRDLDEALDPWVAFALGEGASPSVLSSTDGALYWRQCLSADSYFHLSWRFPVPAVVLRAHSLPEQADAMLTAAGESLPRIAELFIFPGGRSDRVCAVSRDGAGEITLWRRTPSAEDDLPDFADFAVYLERGLLPAYSFAGAEDPGALSTLANLPVYADVLMLPELAVRAPYADVDASARVGEGVLTLFGYNPNKISAYYEADTDTAVYVGTQGTLRASAHRLAYEATAQGGLAVADLVRRSSGTLNLRDDIIACEVLVDALRRADASLAGGEALPQLAGIGTADGMLILEYVYTAGNVAIAADAPAIRLGVRDHRIVGIEVTVAAYTVTETVGRASDQRWMRNLAAHMAATQETAAEGLSIALRYTATVGDAARLRADWVLEMSAAVGGRR